MKRFSIALAILMLCLVIIAGCATPAPATPPVKPATPATAPPKPAAPAAPQPQYGGTLKIIWAANPVNLGYPPEGDPNTGSANIPCVQSLLWNDETGSPVPLLATAWEVSPDGKAVTFNLRKGVKFHDGTDFNADALKWNYDAVIAKNAVMLKPIISVDVLDPYTVRLNLSQFSNVIFNTLAFSGIVSPTAVNQKGKDWAKINPVGTGPFKFVEFKSSVSTKWAKFDDYWEKGKPYLDAIEYEIVADRTVASMAFQKGQTHILMQTTEQIANDLKSKGFVVKSMPGSSNFLASDSGNSDSPFANLKVRQAVEYAIDKQKLVAAVGYGLMTPSNQLAPPQIAGYNPDIKGREYDPAKAKQLLKEAGYPTGFKTTLITQSTQNQDIVVALQTYLKEVGIDATLDVMDTARWADTRTKGWKNGLAMGRTGLDPNMNQRLVPDLGAASPSYPNMARPAQWQPSLDESVAARDLAGRKVKLQQVMKINYDEAFVIPLWISSDIDVEQASVNCDYLVTHHIQWKPGNAWLGK